MKTLLTTFLFGLILVSLTCAPLPHAEHPTVFASEVSLAEATDEAADWWNTVAGCQVFVQGEAGWYVTYGGELGKAATWPELKLVTVNGVGGYHCIGWALIHEFGHILGFSHEDGDVMAPKMLCGMYSWPPPVPSDKTRAALRSRCAK